MKYYVTTPIYYVNAKPHIGHIYTTIAADVLARWQRQSGQEVLFSTGTDENSQKSVEAAAKVGQEVKVFIDQTAALWQKTFQQLGFTHDIFIRTTSPEHAEAVHKLLTLINKSGDIYLGDYEGFYCVSCEEFKTSNELVDGKCPIHHSEPNRIKEKNYFFKLSAYRNRLLELYEQNPNFVQPASARNKMLDYIRNDLTDVSISRQSQLWGIRLPQDEKHAVYVWFDALINYLTVAGYAADEEKFRKYWPVNLHLVGKEIIKFHCAIWPAMLMSAKLELPSRIFANGWLTVDGEKMSKTLGNIVDPLELTKEYPFDAIRYYLLRDIPFGNDGDFSHQRLKDRYNADLANGLGNLVSRVLNMLEKYSPNLVIASSASAGGRKAGRSNPILNSDKLKEEVDSHLGQLAFDKALAAIWQAIAAADEYIEKTRPWELARQSEEQDDEAISKNLSEILTNLYHAIYAINASLEPFMPDTHDQISRLLEARPLKKPAEPLFARKI